MCLFLVFLCLLVFRFLFGLVVFVFWLLLIFLCFVFVAFMFFMFLRRLRFLRFPRVLLIFRFLSFVELRAVIISLFFSPRASRGVFSPLLPPNGVTPSLREGPGKVAPRPLANGQALDSGRDQRS